MTEQHDDILQCDKDLGREEEPGKALARSEALLPASVAGACADFSSAVWNPVRMITLENPGLP